MTIVRDILDCPKCMAHFDYGLVGACASVGIEHGKSTRQMLLEYLAAYHTRGHVRQ
jgi:hypothetical protein